jgi:hypothetical protein
MICTCKSDNQDTDCPIHGSSRRSYCLAQLEAFRAVQDNWDEDGASAPSTLSINKAIALVKCVVPDEVDLDVMGGIALYFYGENRLWIHVNNSGNLILTISGEE